MPNREAIDRILERQDRINQLVHELDVLLAKNHADLDWTPTQFIRDGYLFQIANDHCPHSKLPMRSRWLKTSGEVLLIE